MFPRSRLVFALGAAVGLLVSGCTSIPREDVPADWSLNVHQPGAWWTQPLIPRSVVVQRCPPPRGWSSDPDLSKETALPPGTSVNYIRFVDDYHCNIGWSQPEQDVATSEQPRTEAAWRRVCSRSGLPMDAGWRFLGQTATKSVGAEPSNGDDVWAGRSAATAGFIDTYGTVVGCSAEQWEDADVSVSIDLTVGADLSGGGTAACPVTAGSLGAADDGTVEEYVLQGAGAVRDDHGRALRQARTLRIGLSGDSQISSHPVVDGIAIIDAQVRPAAAIAFESWDHPPPVEGQVLDEKGRVLATCSG